MYNNNKSILQELIIVKPQSNCCLTLPILSVKSTFLKKEIDDKNNVNLFEITIIVVRLNTNKLYYYYYYYVNSNNLIINDFNTTQIIQVIFFNHIL